MKKMFKPLKRKVEIEYWWRRDGDFAVPKHHVQQLEEAAMTRIKFMMEEGYTEGQLHENLLTGKRATLYSGGWTSKTTEG